MLRDAGDDGLRLAAVKGWRLSLVEQMCGCGAVGIFASKRGARVRLHSPDAFDRFVMSRHPAGLDVELDLLASRAEAAAKVGNAKAVRRGACEGLFLRSSVKGVTIRNGCEGAVPLPVGELTEIAGGAAILLTDDSQWSFAGLVVVVENAEPFWQHQVVFPEADLAVYAPGRMSRRLLDWLASSNMYGCEYIHWGDYDPIGLYEFQKLSTACPGRVRLFFPDIVAELLPRLGKRELIDKQQKYLHRLRVANCCEDAAVRMISLFDQFNRGLEQEAVWDHYHHLRRT
jgi:hypothetical protein